MSRFIRSGWSGVVLFAAVVLTFTLFGTASLAEAQGGNRQRDDRDAQARVKQQSQYEKNLAAARDAYNKDPTFKSAVEDAYAAQKREHSEYAFAMNTRDRDDTLVTRSGDTYKIEDTLYDSPLVQQYVNRLGQSLVPQDSKNLYAFRLLLNPVPMSRALATGTIYISTGFVSLVDNEAQLAYILSHEIAHVEKEHWKDDVLLHLKQEKDAKGGGLFSNIGGAVAGRFGGGFGVGVQVFLQNVPTLVKLAAPGGVVGWDASQENEADQLALQYLVQRNYDPEAVPALHAKLAELAKTEKRASFGFIGNPNRVSDSETSVRSATEQLKGSIGNRTLVRGFDLSTLPPIPESSQQQSTAAVRAAAAVKATAAMAAEAKSAASGELIADSGKFQRVMAELKRDNGIQAFSYDMFSMALQNLEGSLEIYSEDALTRFALGRVLWLTARTPDQRGRAFNAFDQAIKKDVRGVVPQAYLYKALIVIDRDGAAAKGEIVPLLQDYVRKSRLSAGGALPPDMMAIYDYLQQVGEVNWVSRPASTVYVLAQAEDGAPTGPALQQAVPVQQPQPATPNRNNNTPNNGRGGRAGGAPAVRQPQ